jgi:hypothetical protein
MAFILLNFVTSSAADNTAMAERRAAERFPINIQAAAGQSIADAVIGMLVGVQRITEISEFIIEVNRSAPAITSEFKEAWGFSVARNIKKLQLILEVSDDSFDDNMAMINNLIGLVFIDANNPNGMTLKQAMRISSNSDAEIAQADRSWTEGIFRIKDAALASTGGDTGGDTGGGGTDNEDDYFEDDYDFEFEDDEEAGNKSSGTAKTLGIIAGVALLGGTAFYVYKKNNRSPF